MIAVCTSFMSWWGHPSRSPSERRAESWWRQRRHNTGNRWRDAATPAVRQTWTEHFRHSIPRISNDSITVNSVCVLCGVSLTCQGWLSQPIITDIITITMIGMDQGTARGRECYSGHIHVMGLRPSTVITITTINIGYTQSLYINQNLWFVDQV